MPTGAPVSTAQSNLARYLVPFVPLAALKGKPAAKKPAAKKKKKKTAGPKKKIKKKDSKNSKVPHPRPLVRCAGYALLLTGWLAGCFD